MSTNDYISSNAIKDSKLYGNVCAFSVDYSAITNDTIQDIHKYLMGKKQCHKKCLDLLKNGFSQQ